MLSTAADVDILPALPAQALNPVHSTQPFPGRENIGQQNGVELSRSASFTDLSRSSPDVPAQGIKRTFSENVLALPSNNAPKPSNSSVTANKELFRRASKNAKNRISVARFTLSTEEVNSTGPLDGVLGAEQVERAKALSRSVTGTIRSLARKSWIVSSPKPQSLSQNDLPKLEKKRSKSPTKTLHPPVSDTIAIPSPVASRSSSRSSTHDEEDIKFPEVIRSQRQAPPLTDTATEDVDDTDHASKHSRTPNISRTPSSVSLRSKSSWDRFQGKIPFIKIPPIPTSISSERLSTASSELSKKKDPLWGAFRSLEAEHLNFQSKSSSQKAKVIRTSLLPFLGKHADNPSNKTLRCEDLDRRIMVLNKWWTAVLEMLNGRNSQAMSATDRPAMLEGVLGIMMRPEWRVPPFTSNAGTSTPQRPSIPISKSSRSLESQESDFLAESIHHNVRNMFIQNLLSQMAFVVERMSMRNAPASLVAFSGKTCAYAFFFCPGVADVLVRLWHIPPGTLRRLFADYEIDRGHNFSLVAKTLASSFPPPIRSLSSNSQASLARHLQHTTAVPPGASYIRWYGPWIGRWSGRDSDLLFVFTKYFHILVSEHLPSAVQKQDRVCIPGLIPVHAQILTVLETTLYRRAGQTHAENVSSSTAEGMDSPDASIPLPMTIANASRAMAENRLIMLLRDLLADSNPNHQLLRELYVTSFDTIIKVATRKISVYNNDACFVLCDFMEEVLPIMLRHHQAHNDTPILDFPFWLLVCRQMMASENSLTEVRLLAFVYSTWTVLISNEDMKRSLVLDWILDPEFFDRHFNHWCPMVRHYFHRLICWRVARYDGQASNLDMLIYEALAARLNTSWAHYQYLNAEAEMRGTAVPSSAPCTPAPSRRLLIVRTDSVPIPTSLLTGFDRVGSPPITNQPTPYRTHSSLLNTIPAADSPTQNKKRWSLFRNIMPFNTTPGNSRPGEVTPPAIADELSTFDSESANGDEIIHDSKASSAMLRPTTPPYQSLAFKFSLEWLERPSWPAKNRRLTPPRLPPSLQVLLHSQIEQQDSVKPTKPRPEELNSARYSGRALAEWAQVVQECGNFFERRRQEGVPYDRLVETPMLGVESFRISG